MKHNYLLMVLILFISIISCKKSKENSPFSGTTYSTLGKFDKYGLPNYLLPKDVISSQLQNLMSEYLVSGQNLIAKHPELFTNSAIADIKITKPSKVYMTFVQQEAGSRNALAFYTYPSDNPPATAKDIKNITYAFPNVGGTTTLQAGDKVYIGQFNSGTSIGFVLMINAWNGQSASLNNNSIHYCTNHVLNPEKDPGLRKHAVLIEFQAENKVLIGFEDMDRENPNCDNDFNDAVFYCTVVI